MVPIGDIGPCKSHVKPYFGSILGFEVRYKGCPMGPFHGTFWLWGSLFYGPLVGI